MISAIYIIGTILLIGSLVSIFFIAKNERLNTIIYKLDMCDRDLDDNLKKKEDEILRLINIINRELDLDIKDFEEVRNIKSNKLTLNEKDILLSRVHEQIKSIYKDNFSKLNAVKSFDGIMNDLDREEIKFISLRTLFNKNVEDFNSLYYKFPYTLIVRIRKIDKKYPYAGVELKEAIEKELDNLVI